MKIKTLLCSAIFCLTAPSFAAEKVALVIGNSQYHTPKFPSLTNPHWDAVKIRDALVNLGFKVHFHENLNFKDMQFAATDFNADLTPETEVALIFYAGHGVEVLGKKGKAGYLIPVDIEIRKDKDRTLATQIGNQSIPTEFFLQQFLSSPKTINVLILDACRELPDRGLSHSFSVSPTQIVPVPKMIISYSTSSGETASDGAGEGNSPYTKALLKYLQQPNLSLLQVFSKTNGDEALKHYGQIAEFTIRGDVSSYLLKPSASSPPRQNLTPTPAARETEALSDHDAEKLWQWADEFQIPADKLPRKKADLLALTELDLKRLFSELPKITYLPPEIGKLTQLQKLNLGGNNLQTLPPEIGNLTQLQKLYLWGNKLQTLSPEIGKLNQLKILSLWDNKLQTLPPETGKLSQLQELYLSGNKFQTLPPEIGKLTQLQKLWLEKNNLRTLPSEIGNLTQLQKLLLYGNNLQTLPKSFLNLKKLASLDIRENKNLKLTSTQRQFLKTIKEVKQ